MNSGLPDHGDFLPALQAIEHTAPHPLPRMMIITIGALVGVGLVWATFGQIDIVATAEGQHLRIALQNCGRVLARAFVANPQGSRK